MEFFKFLCENEFLFVYFANEWKTSVILVIATDSIVIESAGDHVI
jgi:hypothetical protein